MSDMRRNVLRSLEIWSSTSALVGYRTTERKAAGRPPCRNGDHLAGFLVHHSVVGSSCGHPRASRIRRARSGSRNASVLPEPVPEVTTGLWAAVASPSEV